MLRSMLILSFLIPNIFDHHRFMSKIHEKKLKDQIRELITEFKPRHHEEFFIPLSRDLKNAKESFDENKREFSQWKLKSSLRQCLDCHGQQVSLSKISFENDYIKGLYEILTGQFQLAQKSFIDSKKPEAIKQIILTQSRLSGREGLELFLKNLLSSKGISTFWSKEIGLWHEGISLRKKTSLFERKLDSAGESQAFIQQVIIPHKGVIILGRAAQLDLLFATKSLDQYLKTHKDPEASYWLGWTLKRLRHQGFFLSEEGILRNCVLNYSNHPMSRKCFEDYKDSVESRFKIIPRSVAKDLQELGSVLNSSL